MVFQFLRSPFQPLGAAGSSESRRAMQTQLSTESIHHPSEDPEDATDLIGSTGPGRGHPVGKDLADRGLLLLIDPPLKRSDHRVE